MERALKRLERVLELEKQQGYQDKAVVGGIGQFAVFWVSQAREEATDEADSALAEQVSQVLMDYNGLSGGEARAEAIDSLTTQIQRRREHRPPADARTGPTKPKERPVSPQQPRKPATSPKSVPAQATPARRDEAAALGEAEERVLEEEPVAAEPDFESDLPSRAG